MAEDKKFRLLNRGTTINQLQILQQAKQKIILSEKQKLSSTQELHQIPKQEKSLPLIHKSLALNQFSEESLLFSYEQPYKTKIQIKPAFQRKIKCSFNSQKKSCLNWKQDFLEKQLIQKFQQLPMGKFLNSKEFQIVKHMFNFIIDQKNTYSIILKKIKYFYDTRYNQIKVSQNQKIKILQNKLRKEADFNIQIEKQKLNTLDKLKKTLKQLQKCKNRIQQFQGRSEIVNKFILLAKYKGWMKQDPSFRIQFSNFCYFHPNIIQLLQWADLEIKTCQSLLNPPKYRKIKIKSRRISE